MVVGVAAQSIVRSGLIAETGMKIATRMPEDFTRHISVE